LLSSGFIQVVLTNFLCLGQDGQKEKALGMAGQEASPASLFQLYVDYGRLTEATNLLLEYMESFASSVSYDQSVETVCQIISISPQDTLLSMLGFVVSLGFYSLSWST